MAPEQRRYISIWFSLHSSPFFFAITLWCENAICDCGIRKKSAAGRVITRIFFLSVLVVSFYQFLENFHSATDFRVKRGSFSIQIEYSNSDF